MPLPDSVHQVFEQIIAATEGATPDVHQNIYNELSRQFEQIITQTVMEHLDGQDAISFNRLLDSSPDPDQVQQFLVDHFPAIDPIMHEALTVLKKRYLDT